MFKKIFLFITTVFIGSFNKELFFIRFFYTNKSLSISVFNLKHKPRNFGINFII